MATSIPLLAHSCCRLGDLTSVSDLICMGAGRGSNTVKVDFFLVPRRIVHLEWTSMLHFLDLRGVLHSICRP